ncbi:Uma2 family endonuclease [Streptomyces sp. NPDC101227]|uniref:Uma2 family endonuclease n=1 Tax=Streptomyces sp. NPDC101227 TaxID=3366136 RepID=UPI0037FD52CD
MTARADRPHIMETEHFEEAARILARLEQGARLELINGKVTSKPMPDGDRGRIIQWLLRICMQHRPELFLDPNQGLKTESCRKGRLRPDGLLVPCDAFVGQGEWADPDPVLMVVEVTSHDSDTEQRDRVEKPRACAEANIPPRPRRHHARNRAAEGLDELTPHTQRPPRTLRFAAASA